MSTAHAATSPPLSEISTEELRQRRHDLANRIQAAHFQLWALDDELERRQRARSTLSLHVVPSDASAVEVVS